MRCRHARPSKPIQPGNESELRRSFDVTEQNYRLLVCQVLGSMDVGFIEDKVFAVAASRSYQSCRPPKDGHITDPHRRDPAFWGYGLNRHTQYAARPPTRRHWDWTVP